MHLLIVLSVVIFVQGGRRMCGENCIMMYSLPDHPGSPTAQLCKCFGKHAEWLEPHPQKRTSEHDTNYYESADTKIYLNRNLSYPLRYTPYISKIEPVNTVPKWMYQEEKFRKSNKIRNVSPKTAQGNFDVAYRDGYFENSNTPFYLDINIDETREQGVSLRELYQNKMRELTEKNLKDCLDLHIIIHSRNQGKNIEVNILSERNKIYNKLSYSELLIEIDKKCNQSATIIGESIDEIKSKHPYIKNSNNDKVYEQLNHQNNNDTEVLNETSPIYQNVESNTLEMSTPYQLKLSRTSDDGLNVENGTEFDDMFRESSFDYSTINNPQSAFSTDNTSISTLDVYVFSTMPENVQDSYIETVTLSNRLITSMPELNIRNNTDNTDSKTNATDYPIAKANNTILSGSEKLDQAEDGNDVTSEQEPHDSIVLKTRKDIEDFDSFNTSYLNTNSNHTTLSNRTEYLEGDYEIPKLITVELSNETIISQIQGNEAIPNLDFVNPLTESKVELLSTEETPDQNSSESINEVKEWNKSQGNASNCCQSQVEKRSKSDFKNTTEYTSFEINGQLYFKYGLEYIPASLVQKPDGRLNVALDLLLLCKTNKKDMYKLMQAICNCIKFT